MNSDNDKTTALPRGLTLTANIVNDVFSPLLVPTYAMIIAVMLTQLSILGVGVRVTACLGITFITALLPMTFIFILMRMGKVSDASISDPRERTAPYMATIICYLGASAYVYAIHAPLWLIIFFIGAALTSATAMLITHWWKISAHTGATGGLAGILFWLADRNILSGDGLLWVSLAFILVGLVASARLILNRHTLGQVAAGAALGFGIELATLMAVCH